MSKNRRFGHSMFVEVSLATVEELEVQRAVVQMVK
jgi:hypothetical protein